MMESSERKKQKTSVWSQAEDDALLAGILEFLESSGEENTIDLDAVDWDEIATKMTGKTARECSVRVERIHRRGCLFATIEEVWPASERSSLSVASGWDTCKQSVFRGAPPNFLRFHLAGDNREADEFVNTHLGAVLDTTVVGKSVTTVNDALISVDIFGTPRDGAQKAHLLPRAREQALTWLYAGSAVLGLDTTADGWEVVAGKAVLGCTDTKTAIKYPGIRNFLCNLCRVASQGDFYDTNPRVFIFPILDLVEARDWTGTTYEAIVLCDSGVVAQRIGMTNVDVGDASRASLDDVRKAAKLASALCEFLAHSVLQQGRDQVNFYQDNNQQKLKHSRFREDKTIEVPKQISAHPDKPVFKISFVGHDESDKLETGHPAPDPLLLGFKSCNNWCRRFAGFRMVAGAEPEELDGGSLSEDGERQLQAYVEWQEKIEKEQKHTEIMNRFGHEGQVEFAA